jgi:hypothetical protein
MSEKSFDPESTTTYVKRYFEIEVEIAGLREAKKDLKDEFKKTVDLKLVGNVIRLVKAQMKLDASPETLDQLEKIISEKIGSVI